MARRRPPERRPPRRQVATSWGPGSRSRARWAISRLPAPDSGRRPRERDIGLILGLGVDLADIRRIERTLERYGERFTARVFTDVERAKADRRRRRAETYAKRFAAKEACAKALGTGVPRRGVHWRDIGVVNIPGGAPTIALTGGAAQRLAAITPAGHVARIHLTLTDEPPLAQAFVMIMAEPLEAVA